MVFQRYDRVPIKLKLFVKVKENESDVVDVWNIARMFEKLFTKLKLS